MAGTNSNNPPKKHKPTASTSPTKKKASAATPSSPVKKKPATTTANKPASVKKKTPPPPTNTNSSRAASTTVLVASSSTSPRNQKPVPVPVPEKAKQRDEEENYERRRGFYICGAVLCCLLTLLIIALVLGLVLGKNHKNKASANRANGGGTSSANNGGNNGGTSPNGSPVMPRFPTQAPIPLFPSDRVPTIPPVPPTRPPVTPAPVPTTPAPLPAPVVVPTSLLQPSPTELIIVPYADTYVELDGFTPFNSFGQQDTFLVQKGPKDVNEIPTSVGLLGFDISNLPSSYSQIILQLYHQAASRNRGAATYTVVLLPSTNLDIESLNFGTFNPSCLPETVGPTFSVSPSSTIVHVDITSLVRNSNETKLFLMIQDRGAVQTAGDRFYTRETTNPPQLIVNF